MSELDKRRAARHAQHKRYYAQTAGIYPPRRWTEEEDSLVLDSGYTDRQLSELICRSMKAIGNRRCRLKAAPGDPVW